MKPDVASRTAENNAFARAWESIKPEEKRICFDPFARIFLGEELGEIFENDVSREELIAEWEAFIPGVCGAILARTRFIDDYLKQHLETGLEQLVILGAGYDSRARQLESSGKNVRVFELDHPATQAMKRKRLSTAPGVSLPRAVFIPIQFEKERFNRKLLEHGYDETRKTFFIWEGVSYYLTADAVDETLKSIRDLCGEGSSLIFDFFPPSVAAGESGWVEAENLRRGLKEIGEEIFFGIDPEIAESFLIERGFADVNILTGHDYAKEYCADVDPNRAVSEMFVFAHATVRGNRKFVIK